MSTGTDPSPLPPPQEKLPPLPEGWEEGQANGSSYYYNRSLGQSQWDRPTLGQGQPQPQQAAKFNFVCLLRSCTDYSVYSIFVCCVLYRHS